VEAGKFTLTKSLWGLFKQIQNGDRQDLLNIIAQPETAQSPTSRYRLVLVTTTGVEVLGRGLSQDDAQALVETLTPLCTPQLNTKNQAMKLKPFSPTLKDDVTIP
jgi:hypothetical protein